MAIGLEQALFKVNDIDARINVLDGHIRTLQEKYRTSFLESDIEKLLQSIQRRENRFFEIFNLKEGTSQEKLEILQQRIENCRNQVFNLSGPALYEKVLGVLVENNYAAQKKFAEEFREYMSTEKTVNEVLNNHGTQQQLHEAILGILNQVPREYTITTKGATSINRRLSSKQGYNGKTLEQVFVNNFTKAQKEAAEDYIKQKKLNLKINDKVQGNVGTLTSEPTWEILTNGLTPKQAKKLYPSPFDPNLIELWNTVKNFILNLAPTADKNKLIAVIEYFRGIDPYAIFVGKNYNEITGLLGEIQVAYYISVLTNTSFDNPNQWSGLKWLGNSLVDGKKSSTDLILNRVGIQVKNTAKDLEDNEAMSDISFTSLKLDAFLERLNITSEEAKIIRSVYGTSAFNVSYQYDSKKKEYYAADNDDFELTRNNLDKLVSGMEQVFSYFAATLLHICFKKNIQSQPGNTAFFLGGQKIVLASAILASVFEKIKKETTTGLRVKASIGAEGDNIITYLNNNRKSGILSNTLDNITLTSSFNFRTLF